jgi:hypothetical protein
LGKEDNMTKLLEMVMETLHLSSRVRLADKPLPESEAAYSEGRPMTGLWAQLTPEQQKRAMEYRGEESHGSDEFRRRVA